MLPSNKNDLKNYIRRKLGGDFVPLELSDDNMDDVISEAIQFFQQNYYGFSVDTFMIVPFGDYLKDENEEPKDNIFQYLLPENVFSVTGIVQERAWGFYFGKGYVPDETIGIYNTANVGSNFQYVNLEVLEQNHSLVQTNFLQRSIWDYNHHTNILTMHSRSDQYGANLALLVNVYDNLDVNVGTVKYFQDIKFLEYLELTASEQMYSNLKKFGQNELPGGMTVNIEEYKKSDDIKELKEDIIENYCDPTIYGVYGENDF